MINLVSLLPLLTAAAILFAGNGMLITLIALRGDLEGFSATTIGAIGTSYFVGFLLGSLRAPKLIEQVGHIRVFSALAAIGAFTVLLHVLIVDAYLWMATRAVTGFCIAGLFATIESWLNGETSNKDRGRVLSIYSLIDLCAVTAAQFMLPTLGTHGFAVFAVTAMFFTMSLVPVALSPTSLPLTAEPVKLVLRDAWKISPFAFTTCFAIGLTNSSYRTIGPVYASEIGLDTTGVAFFISAGIVGGAILQLPLGWISDRMDRRKVMLFATAGATLAGLAVSFLSGISSPQSTGTNAAIQTSHYLYYLGSFAFGAFAMPLYSLAAAHANDYAKPGQFAVLSAGLLFTFGVAASVGPMASSLAMQIFGPSAFFTFMSICHGSLVLSAIYRMRARPPAPDDERGKYTYMPRTSFAIFRLARRRLTGEAGAQSNANRNGREQ